MVLSVIFALGHLAGGIACAIFAADWNDVSLPGSDSDRMRDSLAASAVSIAICIYTMSRNHNDMPALLLNCRRFVSCLSCSMCCWQYGVCCSW